MPNNEVTLGSKSKTHLPQAPRNWTYVKISIHCANKLIYKLGVCLCLAALHLFQSI